MRFSGIVPAAGAGIRFGGRKQEALLRGRPVWQWARDMLLAAGAEPVVVVGPVPGGVPGGKRRRDSVAAGLALVPSDVPYVLVHDAVRPLATAALASRVLARLIAGGADAVVPALPVRDTIKRVDGEVVLATVERSGLVAVQTPQGFRTEALRAAILEDDGDVTDEATLIERAGGAVTVVLGESTNLKVTFPEDLLVVDALAGEAGR